MNHLVQIPFLNGEGVGPFFDRAQAFYRAQNIGMDKEMLDSVADKGVSSDHWYTSSFCSSGTCVGARVDGGDVLITDTKLDATDVPLSRIPAPLWTAFLKEIRGQLPVGTNELVTFAAESDDIYRIQVSDQAYIFDKAEWSAFTAGVDAGEFDFAALASRP